MSVNSGIAWLLAQRQAYIITPAVLFKDETNAVSKRQQEIRQWQTSASCGIFFIDAGDAAGAVWQLASASLRLAQNMLQYGC